MSKSKKHLSLPVGGSFTPILNTIHDSKAYLELTGNAAKLLGYLIRAARTVAYKLHASSERSVQFDYTYSEAKKRGFSESTFKRAIKELWAKGFISVVVIGGRTASDARGRMSSCYQLTGCWQTYGDKWKNREKHEEDPWKTPSEPRKGDIARW